MHLPLHDLAPEETLRSLVVTSTVAIIALDREGRITLWNPGAERIFGWTEAEVRGRAFAALPSEHRATFRSVLRQVLEGQELEGIEMRYVRKDGSPVDLLLSIRPLRGPRGRVRGVVGVASDPVGAPTMRAILRRVQELERQVVDTRLHAVEMQLPPHFLFNTLNGIAVLIRQGRNPDAVRALGALSEMLRELLARNDRHEIALREELSFVDSYLQVEKLRFGDRLVVEVQSDVAAEDALVPNMLLQPLVENSIRHGIGGRSAGGRITIRTGRAGDRLRLRVLDDGVGLPPGWRPEEGEGIGLRATRWRLAQLHGDRSEFRIENRRAGGVAVSILLPYRVAEA